MHSWSTFGARTSHGQHGHTRLTTARTWGKPPPSPLQYTLWLSTKATSKWLFVLGVSKLAKLGLLWLGSTITLRTNLRWRCGLKQSYRSCRDLFNGMLYVLCSQVNRVDSQLFLVESQTGSLTPGPSFGHNLCFRCPNEQCETILDIYAPRDFQSYKKRHKPLSFDPSNCSLKFWQSLWDSNSHQLSPTPTMGVHLGVWGFIPSHSLHSQEHVMWLPGLLLGPQPCNSLALVASPRLGLRQLMLPCLPYDEATIRIYLKWWLEYKSPYMFENVRFNLIMLALKDLILTTLYSNLNVTIHPQYMEQFLFYAYNLV